MHGDAVNAIAHLAKLSEVPKTIGDRVFTTGQFTEITDPSMPHPPIKSESLQAIAQYAEADITSPVTTGSMVVIVHNPWSVSLSQLSIDDRGKSADLVQCHISDNVPTQDTGFMEGQRMVLKLYEAFVLDDNLQELMSIASDMRSETSVQEISGNRWQVKRQTGVETPGFKEPKPIYWLRPRVTFPEVPQPEVPYALSFSVRDDQAPQIRLVSAGGNSWRPEAIQNIRTWLESATDYHVI